MGPVAFRIPPRRLAHHLARAAALFLLAVGGSVGCAPKHPSDDQPLVAGQGHTRVRVENQRHLDLDVYAVYQLQRIRLGTVSSESSQVFELPRRFVHPGLPIQFLASPIGGAAMPISDDVVVNPGDEVNLVVAPN